MNSLKRNKLKTKHNKVHSLSIRVLFSRSLISHQIFVEIASTRNLHVSGKVKTQ